MFSFPKSFVAPVAALTLSFGTGLAMAQPVAFPGVGRAATPAEIQAWNIDVRPDLQGLPKGSGSVATGQDVWEAKCASCHGIFGESGEVFSPLIGGTTKEDVQSGRVKRLTDPNFPGRTAMMKLSTVSTLWDFINRAMPWNQPKSLSVEEVYGVTAYMLNLSGVLPDDFVLSNANMAEVQKLIPNRNGMTTRHAMWPGNEFGKPLKPDVQGGKCMRNCTPDVKVASFLPDFARDSHGNLAEQMRATGQVHGAVTLAPGTTTAPAAKPGATLNAQDEAAIKLVQKHQCTACHAIDGKLVGPAFNLIAAKHAQRNDLGGYLSTKILSGGVGVWGVITMPEQKVPPADLSEITAWLTRGAPK